MHPEPDRTTPPFRHRTAAARHGQRGIAAVLFMLLVGLALTATVLGTGSALRGAQEQHLAVHTQTRAQLRAWTGVEVVRAWLSDDHTDLPALAAGPIAISGLDGVSAALVSNQDMGSGRHRLVVHVTGSGAGANSVVEVVFEAGGSGSATPPAPPPATPTTTGGINAVTIRRDLELTGNITVTGNASANITVEGNAVLRGSVSGINRLCTLKDAAGNGGNMEIHSAISVAYVCVDGDLELTGSAGVGTAEVAGDVLLSGGSSRIDAILANGEVVLNGGSASAGSVRAGGDVRVTGGNARADTIVTESDVRWTSSNSATRISANGDVVYEGRNGPTAIEALGNVTLSGGGNVATVTTKGDTSITSWWGNGIQTWLHGEGGLSWANGGNVVAAGSVGGSLSGPNNGNIRGSKVADYTVDLDPFEVPEYVPQDLPETSVDVYPLKAAANYVFEVDGAGRRKVTVQGVSGVPDGSYFLGDYGHANGRGYKDFLCTALKANNKDCLEPATPFRTICEGFSSSNGCIEHQNGKWTINGKSLAPGVVWVDGDLKLSNGVYFNTFLATGGIETGGSMRIYSVNYAGYAAICTNNRSSYTGATASPADFAGLVPTAYCNTGAGTLSPSTLGNAALIAGGYRNGVFQGGNIALGASNQIFGSVIAGNVLSTNGNTDVTGVVIVAAQSPTATETRWTGSTTIRIPENIPDFDPGATPFDPPATPSDPPAPTQGTRTEARVRWSRYL